MQKVVLLELDWASKNEKNNQINCKNFNIFNKKEKINDFYNNIILSNRILINIL